MQKKNHDEPILVLITAPSMDAAEQLGEMLVSKKLAACVNILPGIRSIYRWEGEIEKDSEVLMLVKTGSALFDTRLVPEVIEAHPYDVPEVIALPIHMGSQLYLDWIFDGLNNQ